MARQGVVQYTATQGQTGPFLCPFYVYDVAYLSVYLTRAGSTPNDTTNLLNSSQYTGTNSSVPDSSYITLITPANVGDLITIFYEFANATVIPQYPYCSAVDSVADGILPVLPPNNVWIKSSDGSKITTAVIPGLVPNIPVVSGSPVTNTIVKFTSDGTSPISIRNSNTTLTSIKLASGNVYDNVAGINNLSMAGALTIGNIDSSLANYKLAVTGSVIATSLETAFSLVLNDLSNINKTYINSPTQYNDTITYTLPESQAVIPASLLANDAGGNLSWLPQTGINAVGTILQGYWQAGQIDTTESVSCSSLNITNINNNNKIVASIDTYGNISGTSLGVKDNAGNTSFFFSPVSFGGDYSYVLPPTIGQTNQVLGLYAVNGNTGILDWITPQGSTSSLPATPAQVKNESASGVYVEPTTLHYHPGIAKVMIRFHTSGPTNTIIYTYQYPYNATVSRVTTGIYDIIFPTANYFSSATSYVMQASGFNSQRTTNNILSQVIYIVQLHPSFSNGAAPTAGRYRIALYDSVNELSDPTLDPDSTYPAPDVCLSFFGTLA